MKIKSGFSMRNIAGSNIFVPVGKAGDIFNGMITLNDSGAIFWECLKEETTFDEIVNKVLEEYEIDEQTVKKDVEKFLDMLRENNLLDE